ncbi:Uncharacterised protein [Mycobacterium tuberculosis]|nr:Uncharacterised protein [Mycobacterium tuberculosis]CKU20659.1 Uncharacterised protein [Mycobacterium tuberculosis]CKU34492.1 Uncharacterised protein [Mycobacterium tuberculosis]CNV42604.1 Uncharacterised protein [Mycobacterium tuberculosis]
MVAPYLAASSRTILAAILKSSAENVAPNITLLAIGRRAISAVSLSHSAPFRSDCCMLGSSSNFQVWPGMAALTRSAMIRAVAVRRSRAAS